MTMLGASARDGFRQYPFNTAKAQGRVKQNSSSLFYIEFVPKPNIDVSQLS
jgi:hypothetical protein